MKEKATVKMTKDIWTAWDEVRQCVALIKDGKARIVVATRKDGSTYRYTKPVKIT